MSVPPGADLSQFPVAEAPDGYHTNFTHPSETLVSPLIGVNVTMIVLAATCLSMRFAATLNSNRKFWVDDFLAVAAFILAASSSGLAMSNLRTARHSWDIHLTWLNAEWNKMMYAYNILQPLASMTAKISILLLYYRMFSANNSTRWNLRLAVTLTIIILCLPIIAYTSYCTPRSGESWNPIYQSGRCSGDISFFFVHSLLIIALDLYITIIPIPLIAGLNLSSRKKLGIIGVFVVASLAAVAASLTAWNRFYLWKDSVDINWHTTISNICGGVENYTAIIVGSTPACTSYFKHKIFKTGFFSALRPSISSGLGRLLSRSTRSKQPSAASSLGEVDISDAAPLPTKGVGGTYIMLERAQSQNATSFNSSESQQRLHSSGRGGGIS